MTEFEKMGLKPTLLSALKKIGFEKPTEVQDKAIPVIMSGKDTVVRAKTGTGKTGAFLIPIIQKIEKKDLSSAIVIAPTRELALQVTDVAKRLAADAGLSVVTVYGGASIERQIYELRKGANIIVGTPGRLIDIFKRGELHLDAIRFLVLDEADIMFDMGFIEDIEYIISKTRGNRQTMLFSATMPDAIVKIANRHMNSPERLSIGGEEEIVVNTITHYYAIVEKGDKFAALLAYIDEYKPDKAIIFTHTQIGADVIYRFLKRNGFDAVIMHGGLSQSKREYSLSDFRKGTKFLIATNVAARGLDISGISDVINFDVSEDPAVYVHRVGRSARMGANGRAFSILIPRDRYIIWEIENMAKIKLQQIELNTKKYKIEGENIQYSYDTREAPEGGFRRRFHGGRTFGGRSGNRFGHGRFGARRNRYPRRH